MSSSKARRHDDLPDAYMQNQPDFTIDTAVVVNALENLISGRVHDLDMLKSISENLKAGATQADIQSRLLTLANSSRKAFQSLQESRDTLVSMHRKSTGGKVAPVVDRITGFPNKVAFESRLEEIFNATESSDTVLMLVEIGALQMLANESGPEMAQKVVRRFAAVLRKTLKSSDFVAYLSPQHFAVIFEKLLPDHAAAIALRIHKAMEASMSLGKNPVMKMLSVTIGITHNKPEDKSAADLLSRAQESLLTARKQVGAGIYMA